MNMEEAKKVTKDTLVPLSAVAALLTSIIGFGELKAQVAQSVRDNDRQDAAIVEMVRSMHRMEIRQVETMSHLKMKNIKPVPKSLFEDEE